jgi:methyl-accepting chemotaxis protein
MQSAMEQQSPVEASSHSRLSFEAGAGVFVGTAVAGAVALFVDWLTGSVLLAFGCVMAVSAALAWWSKTRASQTLGMVDDIVRAAEGLSDGSTITRLDEEVLGSSFRGVAQAFNRVFDAMRAVAHRVMAVVHRVQDMPGAITHAMQRIQESADAQEEAVEETASLLANINSSMRDINERVEKLQRSAEESASSILQMGSSVDEVARNAATLHESVEASTSSVHEISASIRQVAQSAEQVDRAAEETAASMIEMDRVVQEMSTHAKEASQLTERVSQGAERGSQAVNETINDIQRIHDRTSDARDTLGTLVRRISEIDGILNVIGEINDETNLLSLNAAIIAAQAGEQGKAFLVVANHVKTLAKRTAASTKDIEILVQAIQAESGQAVEAMSAGIEAIDQGVSRSRAAGSALSEILQSSHDANQRVEGIARATAEQSKSSKLVSRAAQDTSAQVQQIASAMSEQSKVSESMLQNAERALEVCRHVHRSTDEQRETGRYITESISNITDMIRQIRESTDSHANASESVSDSVMRLLENAQRAGKQVPEIKAMLEQLSESAQMIVDELSRFEGTDLGFDS